MSQMFDKRALLLRVAVGEATDTNGTVYELSNSTGGTMMVKSGTTGKTFVLNWEDVIHQAVEAGINNHG